MTGKIVDGIKYIELSNNDKKSETLVDKVVDVLRDIFWNGGDSDLVLNANDTVKLIVRDQMYIDGNKSNDILYKYHDNIQRIFKYIKESSFYFEEGVFENDEIYTEFSQWYANFTIIKSDFESILSYKN